MWPNQLSRAAPAAEPEISEMAADPVFGPYDIESAKKKLTEFGKLGQKLGPVPVEKKTGSDL
jgi:hypothetical protein